MESLWAILILLMLFAILIVIALYVRGEHQRNEPEPPKDPRRTDTQLMPRIIPTQQDKEDS